MLIYTDRSPWYPEVSTWGLVPYWVKDKKQLKELWNKTLNARGETIFEKPSFLESAKHNRFIIYVNGFYEHHHLDGKTFPFYIHQKTTNLCHWQDFGANGQISKQGRSSILFP